MKLQSAIGPVKRGRICASIDEAPGYGNPTDCVHIGMPNSDWNVVTVVGQEVEHRQRAVLNENDPYADGWAYVRLNPADPKFFDNLDKLVRSSLKHTKRSIENHSKKGKH